MSYILWARGYVPKQLQVVTVLFSFGLCSLIAAAAAKGFDNPVDVNGDEQTCELKIEANDLVMESLYHEIYGRSGEAQKCLEKATEINSQNAALCWRKGLIHLGGKWVSSDEIAKQVNQEAVIAEYVEKRKQTPDAEPGQLEMARWCIQKSLFGRAKAHLECVIELNPENQFARMALGHREIDGIWYTFTDLVKQHAEVVLNAKRIEAWDQEMASILNLLSENKEASWQQAINRIKKIKDASAIFPIEMRLVGRSNQLDKVLIEHISTINSLESVDALSRFALFHPDQSLRTLAAKQLRTRDQFDFVPPLLSSMSTPWISQYRVVANLHGRVFYQHTLFRQEQDQHRVLENNQTYLAAETDKHPGKHLIAQRRTNILSVEGTFEEMSQMEKKYVRNLPTALRHDASYMISDNDSIQVNSVESLVQHRKTPTEEIISEARHRINEQWNQTMMVQAAENLKTEQLNQRICEALRMATGTQLDNDPRAWWSWWNHTTESAYATSKSVNYDRNSEVSVLQNDQGIYSVDESIESFRTGTRPHSCLIAGTLVQTERGPLPVETIKTGDYVLTKKTDTGQIVYQPVIRPTVNPEAEVFDIDLGTETITSTGGHLFWVSGEGWVKARELHSGMPIHALDGVIIVQGVTKAGKATTHNLVVAENHNYFVGKTQVLSHDITVRQPTETVVPGLMETR